MNTIALASQQSVAPTKIVCVGRNYVQHIVELGNSVPDEMILFVKPNSALADTLQAGSAEPISYEAEISLLVEAGRYRAVAIGLDLTRRQTQKRLAAKGLPWERCKAFDGSALFSTFSPFDGELDELRLELWIDGALAQAGGVDQMIHRPEAILAEIQSVMTLEDGDIVMTGTPSGVGEVKAGSTYHGKVFRGNQLLAEQLWIAK